MAGAIQRGQAAPRDGRISCCKTDLLVTHHRVECRLARPVPPAEPTVRKPLGMGRVALPQYAASVNSSTDDTPEGHPRIEAIRR